MTEAISPGPNAFFGAGQGERRCHAHKKNGDQCGKWGVKGTEPPVCPSHGGASPQALAAAEQRLEVRQAREVAAQVMIEPPVFETPADAARYTLAQVQRRAAQFGAAADRIESVTYTDRAGRERVRAVFEEERRWIDSMVKGLSLVIQAAGRPAGDAETGGPDAVEIFKLTIRLFFEDVSSALTDLGIEGDQREKIMDRVEARGRMRLKQSGGMILEQVRMMAGAGG